MRSLIKIYLRYIGGIIGLVFFFLIVEMIVTSGIIQKVYDEGSSRYESNIREMGEKVATNGKNQVENPRELEEMARQAGLSFAMILNENGEVKDFVMNDIVSLSITFIFLSFTNIKSRKKVNSYGSKTNTIITFCYT